MALGRRQEEQSFPGTSAGEETRRRQRLTLAYGALAVLGVVAVAGLFVLAAGSGSSDRGNPHIDQETGSTNGVPPDDRAGIEPPAFKDASLEEAARAADCDLRLRLDDEGHKHLLPTAAVPNYRTNPPTSGDHVEEPYQQADGAYRETPRAVDVVHSLEHGRLAIQYQPDMPEAAQLELIGLFDTMYGGTLLYPNRAMPHAVAAATWTNLLSCPAYRGNPTLAAIATFGSQTWGRFGGERVNTFNPTAPTPAHPDT